MKDYISWLEAWDNYKDAMVNCHGKFVYNEFRKYRGVILNVVSKYQWTRVYTFHLKNRAKKLEKSLNFYNYDPTLIHNVFDVNAVKQGPKFARCWDPITLLMNVFCHSPTMRPFNIGLAFTASAVAENRNQFVVDGTQVQVWKKAASALTNVTSTCVATQTVNRHKLSNFAIDRLRYVSQRKLSITANCQILKMQSHLRQLTTTCDQEKWASCRQL